MVRFLILRGISAMGMSRKRAGVEIAVTVELLAGMGG
jgi:hypothetical protein